MPRQFFVLDGLSIRVLKEYSMAKYVLTSVWSLSSHLQRKVLQAQDLHTPQACACKWKLSCLQVQVPEPDESWQVATT